jgi:phosphoglycerate dehydrogenase-like enzyme
MKAVLQYRASPGFRDAIEALTPDWLQVAVVDEKDASRFAREMSDARALWHVLEPVTAAVIGSAPALGLIQKIGVGVDTIDLNAARARGIAVANMPGTNSRAVAELCLMLMLATLRRVRQLDAVTRAGRGWQQDPAVFDSVGEIHGRTVGLVGYGAVARLLAPMLVAMGARVICTTRSDPGAGAPERRSLPQLLRESDIVSLHVPLTPQTAGMINRDALASMKRGAVLVNTARGGLVNEGDLKEALESGHLRGAGLDVFAIEPTPADNPLLGLANVIVTPHVAWLTPETLARSIGVAIENCRRLRDTEAILHRVA